MREGCDLSLETRHQPHRLEVKGLGVRYGIISALREVEFTAHCGSRLALLGPNGAGKSSLIRALAGLIRPSEGLIVWKGEALNRCTREIAYLSQVDRHREGFPVTVRDVVRMGRLPHLGFWRSFRKLDEDKVSSAIMEMRLEGLENRQIDALSGGQRQRVFLARALAQEAHIVLLDEPFTGLDRQSSLELGETLAELREQGHLVIASHHDLASVSEFFDEALVLDETQVAFGPASEVMEDKAVRNLLSWEGVR